MIAADLHALCAAGKLAQHAESWKNEAMPPGESIMEPKYDGWRIIAYVGENGHVELFARSGNYPPGDLPKIKAELAERFPPGTILDGEAVAISVKPDGTIMNEWGVAQSVLTTLGGHAAADKITFMVFDLIAHRGIDARPLPYSQRRILLERIFHEQAEFESIALTTTMDATRANYELLVKKGFEGGVVKRVAAAYASDKREGYGWFKIKAEWRVDVVIMGFKKGKSGPTSAIRFGQYKDGVLVERGSCKTLGNKLLKATAADPASYIGRVIEIAHNGVDIAKNGSGRFRSPQLKRFRDDKSAESVVMHDA
jgi:ATP-dependent DNA ligase